MNTPPSAVGAAAYGADNQLGLSQMGPSVISRRDEFVSIIASAGADGLIKRLQDRTQTV
jgi:hypothetical protein